MSPAERGMTSQEVFASTRPFRRQIDGVAPIGQLGMSCCTEDSPLGVTQVEKAL